MLTAAKTVHGRQEAYERGPKIGKVVRYPVYLLLCKEKRVSDISTLKHVTLARQNSSVDRAAWVPRIVGRQHRNITPMTERYL